MNIIKYSVLSIVVLGYLGCGGGSDSKKEAEVTEVLTTYKVKVVDDSVVGATVEAIGCKEVEEIGQGEYTFKCSTPPQYISAKGGFVDLNNNGLHDSNEVTMGLPLLVNLNQDVFDVNLSDISVTPLTTLVANVTDNQQLISLASKLGISEKDFMKDLSGINLELFQKINSLLIIAEAWGITDQLLLMKKFREQILISAESEIGKILNDALENLKNDTDLKQAYGEVFISGFINESQTFMSKTDVLKELSDEYADSDSTQIYITGFIYDAVIANASIKVLDGELVVGEVNSSAEGRWKISINESVLSENKVLLFTGTAIDGNGDSILLKSVITAKKLKELSKKRISVADSIDLVISNVTTAEVAILEKNDPDFLKKPEELEAKKNKIEIFEQELLLKIASAIKSVIDGESKIGINEDTYSFIFDNLVSVAGENLILNLDGKISDEELAIQSEKIKDDSILSKQLLNIENEQILTPILEKSLYTVQYLGTPLTKQYKKIVISNDKAIEKSYKLENGVWKNTSSVEYSGKVIDNIFYFDNQNSNKPYAISLKEQDIVYSTELNKNYTFSILSKQLYLPYEDEDSSKVSISIHSESFDIVTLFKDSEESKIMKALGTEYVNGTIEEQNLALNRYIIAKVKEVPEPFDRTTTKLDDAIDIAKNMNLETDDIATKLSSIKSILVNAEVDDKDAQVGKALFNLAEITNSDEVGDLVELNLNGNIVSSNEHLATILNANDNNDVEAQLLSSITDLSETSMEVVHNTVLQLQEINSTLGMNFVDESYVFNYEDFNITNNQSKLLRVAILAAASKLEYLTAFNTVTLDDVKIRTTVSNGITAEYQNVGADPLSVFSRTDVGSLNTTLGAERLANSKSLLLEALDVLDTVVATKEDNATVVNDIQEAQAEISALEASLNGSDLYVIEDKGDDMDRNITTYVDLSALYSATTALDLTHTIGHDLDYKNADYSNSYDHVTNKSYISSEVYDLALSQFYNEPRAKEWIAKDGSGSTLAYDYFPYTQPELNIEFKTIPTGENSHIASVIKKIEIVESGKETISHTGDNVLKYLFNNLEVDSSASTTGTVSYAVHKDDYLVSDTTVSYGAEVLYGNVEILNLDSVKGTFTVKVLSGFVGSQYFKLEIYDSLGHRNRVYGFVSATYDEVTALDKSFFPTELRYNLYGLIEFKKETSSVRVSDYNSTSKEWVFRADYLYHFEGNEYVIDEDGDANEEYRLKYLGETRDIDELNNYMGTNIFSEGAIGFKFAMKRIYGYETTFYSFNETAKDQYLAFIESNQGPEGGN